MAARDLAMCILNRTDWLLWISSMLALILVFALGEQGDWASLLVSLIGATSLIFIAKCHVAGPILMLVFSILYSFIAYQEGLYGESLSYGAMTAPMCILTIISWLNNPFEEGRLEVRIAELRARSVIIAILLSVVVAGIFYFILSFLDTAYLPISTLSIMTSFFAISLSYMRTPYYALAYALNDLVLILLWGIVSLEDSSYTTLVLCFIIFLVNDLYAYRQWCKTRTRQLHSHGL